MGSQKKIGRIVSTAHLAVLVRLAILAVMGFLFLGYSACLAQSLDRHYCKDGYFSFIPPNDWQALNTDKMSGKLKNKLYEIGKDLKSCPASGTLMTICKPAKGRVSKDQWILIYRSYLEGKPDIEIENNWLLEKYQKKRNKRLYSNDYFGLDNTADIKIEDTKCYYEQDIHTAFEEVKGKMNDVNFIRITATILGSRTKTTLFCQFQNNDNSAAYELIGQITESFEYDSGYEFGNPDVERVDARTRTKRAINFFLIQLCAFSLILFVGLLLYRIVSGDHIPVLGIATATVSGIFLFLIIGWLGRSVLLAVYDWRSFLPHMIAIAAMVPIIWKWPGSEISFRKSVIAVCSLFFLLSLIPGIIMGMAAAGVLLLPVIAVILIIIVLVWRIPD